MPILQMTGLRRGEVKSPGFKLGCACLPNPDFSNWTAPWGVQKGWLRGTVGTTGRAGLRGSRAGGGGRKWEAGPAGGEAALDARGWAAGRPLRPLAASRPLRRLLFANRLAFSGSKQGGWPSDESIAANPQSQGICYFLI